MPSNAQPIPFGVLIKPFLDFETVEGSFTNDESFTVSVMQDDNFIAPPVVYIDGLLITYDVNATRRYCEYNGDTRTLYIKNGIVQLGEYVQIFL